MSIWLNPQASLAELNALNPNTLAEQIGIEFVEIGEDYLRATMPVDARTRQPFGWLHGGASVALAETLGSVAANCCVDPSRKACVGLEINANHVRGVRDGVVIGTARPLHLGSSTQVWEIRITDSRDLLVCVSRLTMAIIDR